MIMSFGVPSQFSDIAHHGFLPSATPRTCFPEGSELALLDQMGASLPEMLEEKSFRRHIEHVLLPFFPQQDSSFEDPGWLRLYYVRMGFIASAYINQVICGAVSELPSNIAVPLYEACRLLDRPPILSYDGYALYNWKKLREDQPIALGNIDTIQNFVTLYDEHWFILVHVEIEAIAADIFREVLCFPDWIKGGNVVAMNEALLRIADAIKRQVNVLKRIPEHMDPALYYRTFRPYIRFFENVRYAGTTLPLQSQRGETGAQSSIMPALVAFMKIPHRESLLTSHLLDMRRYMPSRDRQFIEWLESLPEFRQLVSAASFNAVLEAMADFRQVHYGWAEEYIHRRTEDPRGTGGTPYMQWLKQLIDETLAFRKK